MTQEENNVEEVQVVTEQNEAINAEVANQQESEQEKNFKALRESKDRYKQESTEKDRIIAELMAKIEVKDPVVQEDLDDWTTKADLLNYDKKVMKKVEQAVNAIRFPNARELISKYAKELHPKVAAALEKSEDLEAAMEAIKMTPSYIRDHTQEHKNVAKVLDNANRPKSTLNAGSSGAVSKASKFSSMTAAERLALQDRYLRGYKE